MRFLDLDLDFFLNKNAYFSESASGRLSSDYKPWSAFRVRRFLERRCGLSSNTPIEGRTLDSHDKVLYFWSTLIESRRLKIPFEVIHVDAHPDLWIDRILHMTSGFLLMDLQRGLNILEKKQVHPDNYLTFAIAYGWIESLLWIPLIDDWKDKPEYDGDIRASNRIVKEKTEVTEQKQRRVQFKILPWRKFRVTKPFDYMALSKSPSFTPLESDGLITIIERYMKQI